VSYQNPFPPQAYLIGAQKAGTSSLAFLLQQHPEISLSHPKETHYFTSNFDNGLEWYRSRFTILGDEVLLDASTSYTMANLDPSRNFGIKKDVAGRIRSLREDAKFIYLLRDPVERTISAYWHSVRFGSERRPLRDAIVENPAYVWTGQYHKQLQKFLEHFDLSAFLLLDFRELERDPAAMARKVVRFLGLSDADVPFDLREPKNRGFQLTKLGRTVGRMLGGDPAFYKSAQLVRGVVPAYLYKWTRYLLITDLEPIAAADREWLQERFREDDEELRKLTGISLLDQTAAI
jgi:hypothetical protein